MFLGQTLKEWKNNLPEVVDSINRFNEVTFRSMQQLMLSYFTRPVDFVPQQLPTFFKFNIGDKVLLDLSPTARRRLNFKYSLHKGKGLFLYKGFFVYPKTCCL